MSSVSWKKLHQGELSAIVHHNNRHDGKDVEYRNRYIDKSKTGMNYNIHPEYGVRFSKTDSKAEIDRLMRRLHEIDAEEPPKRMRKKDRVIAVSFVVTAPEGLPPEQEKPFFQIAYDQIASTCGGYQNVSEFGHVHVDEIHDYIEPITGKTCTSRSHMHVIGLPYLSGIGINGSKFETKSRMRALNKAIDEECRKKLGVPFLTGVGQPCGRSVEDLQMASLKAGQEAVKKTKEEQQKADKAYAAASEKVSKKKQELQLLQSKSSDVQKQITALHAEKESAEKATEIARNVAEAEKRNAEHISEKTEELRQVYRQTAEKYNVLVRKWNGLLRRASLLGIAVANYTKKAEEQFRNNISR